MATFPCSRCSLRYVGPQQTAYPAFVVGSIASAEKMRLCPGCLVELRSLPWLEHVRDDMPSSSTSCWRCPANQVSVRVFVPFYEAGRERQDLYGQLCYTCHPLALREIFGASEPAERPSGDTDGQSIQYPLAHGK